MKFPAEYGWRSKCVASPDGVSLVLANNLLRPIRFQGVIRRGLFPLRLALRALGLIFWNDLLLTTLSDPLDPFLTITPDRLILEAYRTSGSAYGAVLIDTRMFDIKEGTVCGTSQIDFHRSFWRDLQDLRSSRETTLCVGQEGGSAATQMQREKWVQNPGVPARFLAHFLKFQESLGKPCVRLEVAPGELLEILHDLGPLERSASTDACRMEKDAHGQPSIVMEPWEKSYRLSGPARGMAWEAPMRIPGQFRTWHILEELIPYADSAHLQFSDREGPVFCWVKLGGITFVLGVSERAPLRNSVARPATSQDSGMDPLAKLIDYGRDHLKTLGSATPDQFARKIEMAEEAALRLLTRLCRIGHGFFDVQARIFRHRELFDPPLPESTLLHLFHRSEQAEAAEWYLPMDAVKIDLCFAVESIQKGYLKLPENIRRKMPRRKRVYREWHVHGQVAVNVDVQIVVNSKGAVASGRCSCDFYEENLMEAGPCQHMIALLLATAARRPDLPTSIVQGETLAR